MCGQQMSPCVHGHGLLGAVAGRHVHVTEGKVQIHVELIEVSSLCIDAAIISTLIGVGVVVVVAAIVGGGGGGGNGMGRLIVRRTRRHCHHWHHRHRLIATETQTAHCRQRDRIGTRARARARAISERAGVGRGGRRGVRVWCREEPMRCCGGREGWRGSDKGSDSSGIGVVVVAVGGVGDGGVDSCSW